MLAIRTVQKYFSNKRILKTAEKNMKKGGAEIVKKYTNKKTGTTSLIGITNGEKINSFGLLPDGTQISKYFIEMKFQKALNGIKTRTVRTVEVGSDGHRTKRTASIKKFLELTKVPPAEIETEGYDFKKKTNFFSTKKAC